MMKMLLTCLAFVMAVAAAQAEPMRIELDTPNIEPLPFAAPAFIAESAGADQYARDLAAGVSSDLQGSGLFRAISQDAFISQITSLPLAGTLVSTDACCTSAGRPFASSIKNPISGWAWQRGSISLALASNRVGPVAGGADWATPPHVSARAIRNAER